MGAQHFCPNLLSFPESQISRAMHFYRTERGEKRRNTSFEVIAYRKPKKGEVMGGGIPPLFLTLGY